MVIKFKISKKTKEMEKRDKMKENLKDFLSSSEANVIIDGCNLKGEASYLDNQIDIRITEISKEKMLIEIRNNAKTGFSQYKKEYKF